MKDSIKKAAIKLKSIPLSEREWILKKLSQKEREKIDPILMQLDAMSFGQIMDLEEIFLDSMESNFNSVNVLNSEDTTSIDRLNSLPVHMLHNILMNYSDAFLSIFVPLSRTESIPFLTNGVDKERLIRIEAISKTKKKELPRHLLIHIANQILNENEKVTNGHNI